MNKRELLLSRFLSSRKICTDTRKIENGAIFFALSGENFNGNTYAQKALDDGCVLSVVSDSSYKDIEDFMVVEDTLTALQNLALDYRLTLDLPIIGVTGTNGKTTTKELVHAVLSSHLNSYATAGNFNNHIGVPLSVLSILPEHEIAIIEMGANKGTDIKELCEICLPTCGLITNVGEAHLEGFGSFDNIMKTKKELYDFLGNNNSLVFMNKDNMHLKKMGIDLKNKSYYSVNAESPLRGTITHHGVTLKFKWESEGYNSTEVETNLTGAYNLENALAAVAVGLKFHVPANKIIRSLERYTPRNNRSQIKKTEKNTLILDAYNANITSTRAALLNLSGMEFPNEKKLFILGDMLELGDVSLSAHRKMIDYTEELGLVGIFVGEEYYKAGSKSYKCYKNTSDLLAEIESLMIADKIVLIKGSRGIKLEVIEEKL
jgi:UDP-N-acetylmuramoyl-tripeptide--D-alanyl-D-alanine ligase